MTDHMNGSDKARLELDALDRAEAAEQDGKRQVWERTPGETARAYSAFVKFRDLAEKRSFVRVAELLGCTPQNIERWARRWNWLNRCYEYDLVEEEKLRQQMSRDRVAHHRRQIQIGQALQSVAVAALREMQARIEQKLPLGLDPSQVAVLLKLGDELESRGLGEDREGVSRFTRIVVNVGDAEPLPDTPADSSSAAVALNDAAFGNGLIDGTKERKPN